MVSTEKRMVCLLHKFGFAGKDDDKIQNTQRQHEGIFGTHCSITK